MMVPTQRIFQDNIFMLVYPIYALTLRNAKENCSNVQMSITLEKKLQCVAQKEVELSNEFPDTSECIRNTIFYFMCQSCSY